MKVIVACGGTGGHAFPGLAVAAELKRRGHEVVVWDSGRDIESSVMKSWDGPVFSTGARQLSPKNAFSILASILRCRKEMKRAKPDALLAMGSYSSLPPVLAARMCKVKVFLHEANTVPGKAVEFLSRFADTVAISFDMTARYLKDVKTVRTGLPVRASITEGKRFDFIPANAFVFSLISATIFPMFTPLGPSAGPSGGPAEALPPSTNASTVSTIAHFSFSISLTLSPLTVTGIGTMASMSSTVFSSLP